MNTETLSHQFTDEAFEAALQPFLDTPWLVELKRKHWQDFATLPMPKRTDELWRFTKTQQLTLDGFAPITQAPVTARQQLATHLELADDVAARLAFVDNQLVAQGSELPEGVELLSLSEALASHGDRLRSYFEQRAVVLGMDKFFALHMAMLNSGVFLFVPRGVEIEKPIELHYLSSQTAGLLLPHTFIVTEDNTRLTLLEYHGKLGAASLDEAPCLSIGAGSVFAGPGSTVKRHVVQNHPRGTHIYQTEEFTCDRDAHVDNLQVNLGGSYARFEGHAIANGPGADVHLYSLAAPNGEQVFDQRTLQTHKAPHARSDLLFKNALLDESQTVFSGLIIVEEAAQQTDAYQTNNNLLLSPTAEANSLPGLEIEANDVKCSHGSTTGQVGKEELFYLNARGIPKRTAFELLVAGFFEEVLGKIDVDAAHEKLAEMLQKKFSTQA